MMRLPVTPPAVMHPKAMTRRMSQWPRPKAGLSTVAVRLMAWSVLWGDAGTPFRINHMRGRAMPYSGTRETTHVHHQAAVTSGAMA